MRYRCLILDHDDTVVDSTREIHYPCYVEFLKKFHPEKPIVSFEDYIRLNFHPGVYEFFRDIVGLTEKETLMEQEYWNAYVKQHVPEAFPEIGRILKRFREDGGILTVISHSYKENLLRDYRENGLPEPDLAFGWEVPREKRKPNPDMVFEILNRFQLNPKEVLVLDDMKPGLVMARAAGVACAAAGWGNPVPEVRTYMEENADAYFETIEAFERFLFQEQQGETLL